MVNEVWAFILYGLAVIPITVCFNQLLFFLFAFYVALRKLHRKTPEPPEYLPGVSIIKPLLGVDPFLQENIISHFELCYPNFEIIFCVEDPNDPAVEVVQLLLHKYPNVDAKLIIGGNGNVVNPLVNNALPAYDAAKYDLIWMSTSRIKVNTDIMVEMVLKSEDPSVALVHQLPFCTDQWSFINAVEKICFGCALGRSAMALNQMEMLCFTGMSYIFKKPILDRFGGFARYGKFLAEDYFLSKDLFENGYKIKMSNYPAQQNIAGTNVTKYISRMVRWLRLRLNMLTIVAAFFEPMIECVNLGFLLALSLRYLFGVSMLTTMAVHISLWMVLDYLLLRCTQGGPLPFNVLTFMMAWWLREVLTYVIYAKAVLHPRTVKWGAHTYHLSLGGHTEAYHGVSSRSSLAAKRTKLTEPAPGIGVIFPEATLAKSKPEHAPLMSLKQGHSWRHSLPNGYIRASVDHQNLTLTPEA
uniref:ceramide glucosyltransferase n=1 Tax=Mesocestoides corti TaxID=53468 RepID=A0A5K3ENC9_MESCO